MEKKQNASLAYSVVTSTESCRAVILIPRAQYLLKTIASLLSWFSKFKLPAQRACKRENSDWRMRGGPHALAAQVTDMASLLAVAIHYRAMWITPRKSSMDAAGRYWSDKQTPELDAAASILFTLIYIQMFKKRARYCWHYLKKKYIFKKISFIE